MKRKLFLRLCLIFCLIFSLIGSIEARGWMDDKTPRSMPVRISIAVASRTVGIGQPGEIRVFLTDQGGQPVAAVRPVQVLLIVTTHRELSRAKQDLRLQPGVGIPATGVPLALTLTKSTVATTLELAKGDQDATVVLRSYRSGMISLFAESGNLSTGSGVVVVLDKRRAEGGRPRVVPAAWSRELPGSYRLEVLAPEVGEASLVEGKWTRTFSVALLADDEFTAAPKKVTVILRLASGSGRLINNEVVIERGESQSEEFHVESAVGGPIEFVADAVRMGTFSAARAAYAFAFPTRKLATRLVVEFGPRVVPANGLDQIAVDLRVVDGANNPISPSDEGLMTRRVDIDFEGETRGLKVVGQKILQANESSARIALCASRPISAVALAARSTNRLGAAITGHADGMSFYFPWVPLFGAIAGGLTLSVLWGFEIRRLIQGMAVGGVFFGLALFGALGVHKFELEGIGMVDIVRLPSDNPFAAYILGFVGTNLGRHMMRKKRTFGRRRQLSHPVARL